MTPDELHKERNTTHGDYRDQFKGAQQLKAAMAEGPRWIYLNEVQRETLEMIATKISRILTGSADVADHWDDIAGYAALPAKQIRGEAQLTKPGAIIPMTAAEREAALQKAYRDAQAIVPGPSPKAWPQDRQAYIP